MKWFVCSGTERVGAGRIFCVHAVSHPYPAPSRSSARVLEPPPLLPPAPPHFPHPLSTLQQSCDSLVTTLLSTRLNARVLTTVLVLLSVLLLVCRDGNRVRPCGAACRTFTSRGVNDRTIQTEGLKKCRKHGKSIEFIHRCASMQVPTRCRGPPFKQLLAGCGSRFMRLAEQRTSWRFSHDASKVGLVNENQACSALVVQGCTKVVV